MSENPLETPYKILLVDDEENVRRALKRALRRENYEIFESDSADGALEFLRENVVDVIISDHLMPKMTGLDLLKVVKNLYPLTLRIILTGQADVSTAIAAINEGEIYRFLTKPWDDVDLKVMLRLALEHLSIKRQLSRLTEIVKQQSVFIKNIEQRYPDIVNLRKREQTLGRLPDDLDLENYTG